MNLLALLCACCWLPAVHGQALRCASHLESSRSSSVRDVRLAENRTLCMQPERASTKIFALSLIEAWIQWAIPTRYDFVVAELKPHACFCDCKSASAVCSRSRLRRMCPACVPLIQTHAEALGCDADAQATSCCNMRAAEQRSVSYLGVAHPALFYRLSLALWRVHDDGTRMLVSSEDVRLNADSKHRIRFDAVDFEVHAVPHYAPKFEELFLDFGQNKSVPVMHFHRCSDAFRVGQNGQLEIVKKTCLPNILLDNCSEQRLLVEEGKPSRIDFSSGSSAFLSESERHLITPTSATLTITIDDSRNPVRPIEDASRISGLRDVRVEVDRWGRRLLRVRGATFRRFIGHLEGAQGTLHFTFLTLSLSARYEAQFTVPSTKSPQSIIDITLPLPASINEACTVCVSPLHQNETQMCAHAPYIESPASSWDLLKTSLFIGSCDECTGATSILQRFASAVGIFVPIRPISRLLSGEPLQWSDLQSLLLSFLLAATLFFVILLLKKLLVPTYECCVCLCTPCHAVLKRSKYSAVAPKQDESEL